MSVFQSVIEQRYDVVTSGDESLCWPSNGVRVGLSGSLCMDRFHSSASASRSEPLESWFWIASHVGSWALKSPATICGSVLVSMRGNSVSIVLAFDGGMYMYSDVD